MLYMFFETADTLVSEEYLIYDLNNIVASVGGSLGLFLGFSCLQFVNFVIEKLGEYLAKIK